MKIRELLKELYSAESGTEMNEKEAVDQTIVSIRKEIEERPITEQSLGKAVGNQTAYGIGYRQAKKDIANLFSEEKE